MEPAIPSGAPIRIEPRQEVPAVDSTVAIVTPGGLVAHRIVGRGRFPWNRHFVLTQGDGSTLCDPPVRVDLILGSVTVGRDDEWHTVPRRSSSARATSARATLWRAVVRCALAVHPTLATALVRLSLRGRVKPVQWTA